MSSSGVSPGQGGRSVNDLRRHFEKEIEKQQSDKPVERKTKDAAKGRLSKGGASVAGQARGIGHGAKSERKATHLPGTGEGVESNLEASGEPFESGAELGAEFFVRAPPEIEEEDSISDTQVGARTERRSPEQVQEFQELHPQDSTQETSASMTRSVGQAAPLKQRVLRRQDGVRNLIPVLEDHKESVRRFLETDPRNEEDLVQPQALRDLDREHGLTVNGVKIEVPGRIEPDKRVNHPKAKDNTRPRGYAMWQAITKQLGKEIDDHGLKMLQGLMHQGMLGPDTMKLQISQYGKGYVAKPIAGSQSLTIDIKEGLVRIRGENRFVIMNPDISPLKPKAVTRLGFEATINFKDLEDLEAIPAGASRDEVLSASLSLIGESNGNGEGLPDDSRVKITENSARASASTDSYLVDCAPAGTAEDLVKKNPSNNEPLPSLEVTRWIEPSQPFDLNFEVLQLARIEMQVDDSTPFWNEFHDLLFDNKFKNEHQSELEELRALAKVYGMGIKEVKDEAIERSMEIAEKLAESGYANEITRYHQALLRAWEQVEKDTP